MNNSSVIVLNLPTNLLEMPTTITDIPSKRVISMVYHMRQELSGHYSIPELEAIIHRTFQELMSYSRIDVMMRSEEELMPDVLDRFGEVIDRLLDYEPLQYIFGHSDFYGLDLRLTPNVLIPRPETEELVHWLMQEQVDRRNMRVLDIGTGSGCIALAIKSHFPDSDVTGIDVSSEALQVARENAAQNNLSVDFKMSNILNAPSNLGSFDMIVSNPPYVTREQMRYMQSNVLHHEPHLALFVEDNDALKFYKAIGHFSRKHLNPDGVLYLEVNEDFAADTADLLKTFNFTNTSIKKDLNGKFRMVKATR